MCHLIEKFVKPWQAIKNWRRLQGTSLRTNQPEAKLWVIGWGNLANDKPTAKGVLPWALTATGDYPDGIVDGGGLFACVKRKRIGIFRVISHSFGVVVS